MEVPTPRQVEKNVFKRLFKDRNAITNDAQSMKSSAVKLNKTLPSKGRQVLSKFSKENQPSWTGRKVMNPATKPESQKHKKIAFKTPATNSLQSKGASNRLKQSDRTPPSVRMARTKLHSARYWLSLVDVAEKAGKHALSLKLFELAIDSGAQPTSDILKCLDAYKSRYQVGDISTQHVEVQEHRAQEVPGRNDNHVVLSTAEAEIAVADESSEIATVKNLYAETYSHIPISGNAEGSSTPVQNEATDKEASSEVVNEADNVDRDNASKQLEVPLSRRTPRRACAIQASIRIQESAKKERSRRNNGKTDNSSSVSDVEKMDVSVLMKEVVSGMLTGAASTPQQDVVPALPKKLRQGHSQNKSRGNSTEAGAPKETQGEVRRASNRKGKKSSKEPDVFQVVSETIKLEKPPSGTSKSSKRIENEAEPNNQNGDDCAKEACTKVKDGSRKERAEGTKASSRSGKNSQATPDPRRSARLRSASHD